jgi:quercetin dioxygenase-like cupin family protein
LKLIAATLLMCCIANIAIAEDVPSPIKSETLLQSTTSWDGTPYASYPAGKPKVTVLKITIAPNTVMKWHSHPVPNVGYILSGVLTIEKKDGTKQKFVAGQAVPETVDSVHRGITGREPVVLIVFYAGTPELPLSY